MESNAMNDPESWNWLQDYETTDAPYEPFYKTDNKHVKIHFVYINPKNNEIQEKKTVLFFLQNENVLSNEEILGLLKDHASHHSKHYTLQSIYVYHVDTHPADVLEGNQEVQLKRVDPNMPIHLHQTIAFFQDLNAVYFFLVEKMSQQSGTRRNIEIKKHVKTAKNIRNMERI
jgi:hypothetical protein